ncbi:MAG: hypothetical protein QXT63_00490 [Thermoplasmata archaeon]
MVGKKFSVVWSVDGSLESMSELASNLESYAKRLKTNLLIGMISSIFLFAVSAFALSVHASDFFDMFLYHPSILEDLIISYMVRVLGATIVIAFSVSLLILTYQTSSFSKVLISRFKALECLWKGTEIGLDGGKLVSDEFENEDERNKDEGDKNERKVSELEKDVVQNFRIERGSIEPVKASISMIEEVMEQIPQILKQIKIALFVDVSSVSAIILSIFFYYQYGASYSFLYPYSNLMFCLILGILLIILGIVSFFCINESGLFYASFLQRYRIISCASKGLPPVVPKGENAVDRFREYLLKNDSRLINAIRGKISDSFEDKLEEKVEILRKERLKGVSGQEYDFSLVYLPSEKVEYLLLVREIGLEDLSNVNTVGKYHKEVKDVIDEFEKKYSKKLKYVRAVLLFDTTKYEAWEVPAWILYKIKEYPILLACGKGGWNDITHIQLVIDEGEMYSFVPMLPECEIEWECEIE